VRLQRLHGRDLPAHRRARLTIALGSFADAVFPPPTTEFFTRFRHPWVPPIPDAVQIYDPLDGSLTVESGLWSTGPVVE
jgi:hypothetical protein